MFQIQLKIFTNVFICVFMDVYMQALPVVQPVATDGACSVHLPSLNLSVKQTGALK